MVKVVLICIHYQILLVWANQRDLNGWTNVTAREIRVHTKFWSRM